MKLLLQILFPLCILFGGYKAFEKIKTLKEPPKSKKTRTAIPIVNAKIYKITSVTPEVKSFGTVESYDETTIVSQVEGKIETLHSNFRVGKFIKKGETVAQIEKTDFTAAVFEAEANVTIAEQELEEEKVLAKQAEEDWLASGRKLATASEFFLRKPQLASAQANLISVEQALSTAKINESRTAVTAPFDSIVTEKSVSTGRYVNSSISIGTLIDSNKVEVRLPLTASQMQRIDITSLPISITLTDPQRADFSKSAKITRVSPTVDQTNQVTFLIAEVDQPYTSPTVSIGSFVNATIPSSTLENIIVIPEAAFVNDTFFWSLKDDALTKIEATRIYSQDGKLYLRPIDTEAKEFPVISRPLSSFREGMKVIDKNSKKQKPEKEQETPQQENPKS